MAARQEWRTRTAKNPYERSQPAAPALRDSHNLTPNLTNFPKRKQRPQSAAPSRGRTPVNSFSARTAASSRFGSSAGISLGSQFTSSASSIAIISSTSSATTSSAATSSTATSTPSAAFVFQQKQQQKMASDLRKELRAVHKTLTFVPSPRRRVVKAGARAVAAASQNSSLTFGRKTLDLYANVGVEQAQTTTTRLSNKLTEAMQVETNITTLQRLRAEAARELVRRCEEIRKHLGIESSTKENGGANPESPTSIKKKERKVKGHVVEYVLPLVDIVMGFKENVQRQRRTAMRLEKSVKQAEKKVKAAEEKAELMRITLDSHLDEARGSSNRLKDAKHPLTTSSSTTESSSLSCLSNVGVDTMNIGSQTKEVDIFDEEKKKKLKNKIQREYDLKLLKIKKENESLKKKVASVEEDCHRRISAAEAMASSLDNTTNLTKMNNKHHIALTSLKNKLASSKAMLIQKNNETKEMKLEIEKISKEHKELMRRDKESESETFKNFVKERGQLLTQIKKTNEDSTHLRKTLIDAETMNNRLSSELDTERMASRTLTRKVQTMETMHSNEMDEMRNQFKEDQQIMFDQERERRKVDLREKNDVKSVESLKATIESERRLVLMKEKQYEENQVRLKIDMKLETKKAQQLQEELEAANLCMEVRRNEHKRKEEEWTIEKKMMKKKLRVLAGSDTDGGNTSSNTNRSNTSSNTNRSTSSSISDGINVHANFVQSHNREDTRRLRSQMNTMQSKMEASRAAHGREVSLLRKELSLEQRRTESLAREVNLLRGSDKSKYEMKKMKGGTSNMVNHTVSSLRDRARNM